MRLSDVYFRAKKFKKYGENEWVYGYLVKSFEGYEIWSFEYNHIVIDKVIPETIGQFTGFVDKDGKRIYDGDIIEKHDWTNPNTSDYIGYVQMINGCWCVSHYEKYLHQWVHSKLKFDDFAEKKQKIIGNKTDDFLMFQQKFVNIDIDLNDYKDYEEV